MHKYRREHGQNKSKLYLLHFRNAPGISLTNFYKYGLLNVVKKLTSFIFLLAIFIFAIWISYNLQLNSKREAKAEHLCQSYVFDGETEVPHCSFSFKAGFPYTFYQTDQYIKFSQEEACYQSKCLGEGPLAFSQINRTIFILDVLLLALIIFALIAIPYWLIFSVLKVPLQINWLLLSTLISLFLVGIPYYLAYYLLIILPNPFIPILISMGMLIIGPLFQLVGASSSLEPKLLYPIMPFILMSIFIYLIIALIQKVKGIKEGN